MILFSSDANTFNFFYYVYLYLMFTQKSLLLILLAENSSVGELQNLESDDGADQEGGVVQDLVLGSSALVDLQD